MKRYTISFIFTQFSYPNIIKKEITAQYEIDSKFELLEFKRFLARENVIPSEEAPIYITLIYCE